MFYSQFILAKKGPLGTIWIAAHLERKLRKNQVADTDIGVSVDSIIFPEVPIALRLSSHLLLGVVRIYSKKVNYLFDDCSDALLKVRQAFRSTAVDLPPEESKAPYHSITLPETFDLDDFELPDNELLQGNFDHHVSAREQITLQDTLDGATLSTSKFGLDERFGDGDASQIGLDLDEALFANKGEASEHGDPSGLSIDAEAAIETDVPRRADEHTEGNSEASRATSANYSSIQAPCTPGLMEEPDLPGAQDALICDDHMDEDNNPNGLMGKEIIGNASVHGGPCQMDSDMVQPFAKEDGCLQDMQETLLKENSLLASEVMDNMPTDDAQHSPSYKQAPASNGSEGRSTFQNGISTNNESNIGFPIHSETVCGESNVFGINGFASENDLTTKNPSPLIPGSDTCIDNGIDTSCHTDLCSPPLGSKSVDAEVALKSVSAEVCKNLDNNINANSGSIGCHPCSKLDNSENLSVDMHGPMLSPSSPVLRACNSHPNSEADNLVSTTNLPSEEVGLSSTDNLVGATNLTSEDVRLHTETAQWQDEHGISAAFIGAQNFMEANTDQLMATHGDHDSVHQKEETIISQDSQLGKEKSDFITNLPSPEKMLSVPVVATTQATELVESTPEKEAAVEENKLISGKKRSYTESTLTVQSLNSVESPGAAQSKRSSDFIPDDDDLLSSILVGRRSTALKLKPTPPAPEMTTTKRPRLAVRASAYKRKALVDDTMVLHGDNIRQQLMNAEDIRRVRKKAPCTRPEIWMLQKQFLEEEIFSEPIFIGMSRVLMNLHREPFDLSGTKILQAESKSHPTEKTELETHASQTVAQVPVFEGYDLASVVRDDQAPSPQSLLKTQNQVSIKPMSVDAAAEPRDVTRIDAAAEPRDVTRIDAAAEPRDVTRIDAAAAYNHPEHDASGHTPEVAIDTGKVLAGDQAGCPQNQVSIKPMSVDAAAAYSHPERDASGHTPEVAIDSGKVLAGDQAGCSVSLYFELSTSVGPMSEENRNLIDSSMIRSDCLDESNDPALQSCLPNETHDQNLDVSLLGHYTSYIKNALEETNDGDADATTGEVLYQDELHRGEDDQFSKKMEGIGALATGVGVFPESSHVRDAKISAETSLQGAFDEKGVQVIEGGVGVSVLNEDEALASDVRYDERTPTSNDFLCEVQKLDSSYEADLNMKQPILVDGENPECQQAHSEIFLDATINIPEHFRTEDYGDFGAHDAEHDTDFLNVDDDDDDEMNEADDNSIPNNQETRMLDNSGWSGRTRAVANYLQALFNKEVQHGTKVLQMDNLLTGKTRKEASRMFFETLVLKTKDYIHVEQPNAYDNVNIKPRVKLMKSEF